MRLLKILFYSVTAICVLACVVLFIFIATFDVNKFKPQIVTAAQKALARPVDFDNARISVSLTRGLSVNIENFSIGEDAYFGGGNFLEVDSVSVGLEVLPLVTRRAIKLTDIVIQSPLVTVIRKKTGSLNVQSIGKGPQPAGVVSGEAQKAGARQGEGPAVLAAPLIYAKSVSVRDAVVKYRDEALEPALELSVSAIDAVVSGFSLDKPWKFRVQAAFLSPDQNLSFTGTGMLDMSGPLFTLRDGLLSVDLESLDTMQIRKILSAYPADTLPSEIGGKCEVTIKEIKAGSSGLASLVVQADLRDGKIKAKKMARAVDAIRVRLGLTESLCTVHEISANMGKGRFSATGQIDDYLARRRFKALVTLDDFDLKDMLDQKAADVQLEGLLGGKLDISGEGLSADSLKQTLAGIGSLKVVAAQVRGVNVLHLALSKITVIPNLLDIIMRSVPESYRDKLTRDSTVIDSAHFDAVIDNGMLKLEPLNVEADGFIFSGRGLAALNRTFSLNGRLAIPKDISERMVSGTKELEFLVDEKGMVSFPFSVRGQDGKVAFTPDLEYISRRFISTQGAQQVDKLLDKVFGSGEETQGESPDSAGDGTTRKVSTERQIIEGVLDRILQ